MQKDILTALKENNIKLTSDRQEIIAVLEQSKFPISPADIYLKVISKVKTNLTTIYRNLELLEGLNLVKRMGFNKNSFHYELLTDRAHHHHVVCQSCGKVEDLENISEKFMVEVSKQTNFKIVDHNLEFFGQCKECKNHES